MPVTLRPIVTHVKVLYRVPPCQDISVFENLLHPLWTNFGSSATNSDDTAGTISETWTSTMFAVDGSAFTYTPDSQNGLIHGSIELDTDFVGDPPCLSFHIEYDLMVNVTAFVDDGSGFNATSTFEVSSGTGISIEDNLDANYAPFATGIVTQHYSHDITMTGSAGFLFMRYTFSGGHGPGNDVTPRTLTAGGSLTNFMLSLAA